MNRYFYIFFIILTCEVYSTELSIDAGELIKYFPECKHSIQWEGASFDPLRIEYTSSKEKKTISTEDQSLINAIKGALELKGIEGIVFGRGSLSSKLLIGGHIFSTADEIQFVDDNGNWEPIYGGHSVILLEINEKKGVFLISGQNIDGSIPENGIQFEWIWEEFFQCQ